MHNENNKKTDWSIATQDDITEIKNAIEFARGLVIKSEIIAESYETITSMRAGAKYVSAVLKLNDTDDLNRQVIIDSYEETNKYYLWLYKTYDISYVDARIANDMTILKMTARTLSTKDEKLFLECYSDVVSYYKQTYFTKAFINQDYNLQYFILIVLNFTIQKYLTRKMENYFDIDTYNKKQLKNSFISFGFDYFDILPVNYQRRLLKILNELVISKGTNHDIRKILDIFGNKNIDIYKYILAKLYPIDENGEYDYDSPYLIFYKTLADGIIDYDKDIVMKYDDVTKKDILWKVDKEEVLYKRIYNKETEEYENVSDRHFNTIISKYMSVDVTTDILKDTLKTSYLFNFLYKFEKDHKDQENEEDFGFFNRDMSSTKISIFTAIVGYISLMLRKLGIEDKINFFPNILNDIYGYENVDNNDDIKDLLNEIQIILIQNKDELTKSRKYEKLYKFFKGFTLYGFENPDRKTMSYIYEMVNRNSSILTQLNTGFERYCKYIPLVNYLKDTTVNVVDKLEFLRKCLIKGKIEPKYVAMYDEILACFKEFVVIEGYKYPNTRSEMCLAITENPYIIEEAKKYINQSGNTLAETAFNDGDLIKFYDEALAHSIRHRTSLTEKYHFNTDKELSDFLITDKEDISFYKNLYAYMQLFYFPFKNEQIDVKNKFTASQFMKIFNMNEDVREQLMTFIRDTNNWQLYYRFNKIFEIKMLTKQNTDLYKPYTTFADYVKANNYEFYKWITERDKDIEDGSLTGKDKKQYFREKLFELAESIDTYLGTTVFTNFPLSGILDFIILTVYLIATVFKAFTVDMIKSDAVLRIDDATFNAIRLFDEVENMQIDMELKSYLKLEDVFRTWITSEVSDDSLNLKDEFKVTTYDDPNGIDETIPLIKN